MAGIIDIITEHAYLKARHEQVEKACNDNGFKDFEELLAEYSKLKAKLNMAIADLAVDDCDNCKFANNPYDTAPCNNCYVCDDIKATESQWQWRGEECN